MTGPESSSSPQASPSAPPTQRETHSPPSQGLDLGSQELQNRPQPTAIQQSQVHDDQGFQEVDLLPPASLLFARPPSVPSSPFPLNLPAQQVNVSEVTGTTDHPQEGSNERPIFPVSPRSPSFAAHHNLQRLHSELSETQNELHALVEQYNAAMREKEHQFSHIQHLEHQMYEQQRHFEYESHQQQQELEQMHQRFQDAIRQQQELEDKYQLQLEQQLQQTQEATPPPTTPSSDVTRRTAESYLGTIQELQAQNRDLTINIQRLKLRAKARITDLTQQLDVQRRLVEELRSTASPSDATSSDSVNQNALQKQYILEEKVHQLEAALAQSAGRQQLVATLQKRVMELERSTHSPVEQHQNVTPSTGAVHKMQSELARIGNALSAELDKNKTLESRIAQLQAEIEKTRADADRQTRALKAKVEALERELAAEKSASQARGDQPVGSPSQQSSPQRDEDARAVDELKIKVKELQELLSAQLVANRDNERIIATREREATELRVTLSTVESVLRDEQTRRDALQGEVSRLEAESCAQQQQIATQQEQLEHQHMLMHEHKAAANYDATAIVALEQERNAMHEELQHMHNIMANMTARVEAAENDTMSSRHAASAVEVQRELLARDVEQLQAMLAKSREKYVQLEEVLLRERQQRMQSEENDSGMQQQAHQQVSNNQPTQPTSEVSCETEPYATDREAILQQQLEELHAELAEKQCLLHNQRVHLQSLELELEAKASVAALRTNECEQLNKDLCKTKEQYAELLDRHERILQEHKQQVHEDNTGETDMHASPMTTAQGPSQSEIEELIRVAVDEARRDKDAAFEEIMAINRRQMETDLHGRLHVLTREHGILKEENDALRRRVHEAESAVQEVTRHSTVSAQRIFDNPSDDDFELDIMESQDLYFGEPVLPRTRRNRIRRRIEAFGRYMNFQTVKAGHYFLQSPMIRLLTLVYLSLIHVVVLYVLVASHGCAPTVQE